MADSRNLKNYGIWNIYWKLAGGDPLKYDEVEKLKMPIVCIHLSYSAEIAAFEKRYSEIKRNKK